MAEKFKPEPDDTFLEWSYGDHSCITVNSRYYFLFMPKTKRNKLDRDMKRLNATMKEIKK